jgi:Na+/melibiose symporter-like transporter
MEKKRHQSKDEKTVPRSWRIAIIIWMIGLVITAYLAFSAGIGQKNPWPLLHTLAIVDIIGAIIIIAGIRAAYRSSPTERTPTAFMKKCVKCGTEIPIASEECSSCGSKQP